MASARVVVAAATLRWGAATILLVPRDSFETAAGGPRSLMLYDCQADFLDMVEAWSQEKKDWCCSRSGMGCHLAQATQKAAVVVNAGFRCDDGAERWSTEWSIGKKAWCCVNEDRGCPDTAMFQGISHLRGLVRSAVAGKGEDDLRDAALTKRQPDNYVWEHDCQADANDWNRSWPIHKKGWCCKLQGIGCLKDDSSSTVAAASPPADGSFDCDSALEAWMVEWSDAKKDWCCQQQSRACIAHDCGADLGDWTRSWSMSKKSWCCTKEGRGCEVASGEAELALTEKELRKPFDCNAAASAWQTEWSDFKMFSCCEQVGRGCSASPQPATESPSVLLHAAGAAYDCAADATAWVQAWSEEKREYCCEQQPEDCTSPNSPALASIAEFDCHAAYKNWKKEWSDQKKTWCCDTFELGCLHVAI